MCERLSRERRGRREMQCGGSSVRPFRRMSRYSRFFIPRMSSVTVLWMERRRYLVTPLHGHYVMYWVDWLHTNCIVEHVSVTLQECGEAPTHYRIRSLHRVHTNCIVEHVSVTLQECGKAPIHYRIGSLHRVCDECTCTSTMAPYTC